MKQSQKIISPGVDEYVAGFPKETQLLLNNIRKKIKAAAPKADEVISYQMPAYKYHGMLVYFAAWKNHIGFYPAGAINAFKKELSVYEVSKGTVRFPIDKPFPFGLISKIVKFRAMENKEKAVAKKLIKPEKKITNVKSLLKKK